MNCLEGSRIQNSPSILRGLPKRAGQALAPAKPLTILPPERMPLPGWIWVAEFDSRSGARTADPDFNSRLYVCWFTDVANAIMAIWRLR